MNINERLKQLRKENGLTQTELAKKLNIGQTTIAAYENGTHDPQIFSLVAYANFFNCSVDFLLGRDYDIENTIIYQIDSLNESEKLLLKTYRSLNGKLQKLLIEQAKVLEQCELNDKMT